MRHFVWAGLFLLLAGSCGTSEKEEAAQFCRSVIAGRQAADRAALVAAREKVKAMKPSSATVKRGQRRLLAWADLTLETADLREKIAKSAETERGDLEVQAAKLDARLETASRDLLSEVKTLVTTTGAADCKDVK